MKTVFLSLSKLLVSYLLAAIALTVYLSWPIIVEGHPHIPFSGFLGVLIFSPAAPFFIFGENLKTQLIGGGIFIAVFLAVFFLISRRRH